MTGEGPLFATGQRRDQIPVHHGHMSSDNG